MDWDMFLILAIGFVFSGFIIGYPIGNVLGARHERRKSRESTSNVINIHRGSAFDLSRGVVAHGRRDDILSADVLEVNHD